MSNDETTSQKPWGRVVSGLGGLAAVEATDYVLKRAIPRAGSVLQQMRVEGGTTFEAGAVYDRTSRKVVERAYGSFTSVQVSRPPAMGPKGLRVLHNHPVNVPLSPGDIGALEGMTKGVAFKHIYAITPDQTVHAAALTKKGRETTVNIAKEFAARLEKKAPGSPLAQASHYGSVLKDLKKEGFIQYRSFSAAKSAAPMAVRVNQATKMGRYGLALAAGVAVYNAMRSEPKAAPSAQSNGAERTKPFTDRLGRRFENGRLIVRDK